MVFSQALVPEEELGRAVVDDGERKPVREARLQSLACESGGEVSGTDGVSGVRKHSGMVGVRLLLRAVDSLLGEKVRPLAAEPVRAVGVVDVHKKVVFCRFCHELLRPFLPLLRAHVDKTRFDALDSPFLIERENLVCISLTALMVDIQEDADIVLLAVLYDGLQVESRVARAWLSGGRVGDVHLARIGFLGECLAIPSPVEDHIVYAHGLAVVYHLVGFRGGDCGLAHGGAGLYPLRVFYGARLAEIVGQVIVDHQVAGFVGQTDDPPAARQPVIPLGLTAQSDL